MNIFGRAGRFCRSPMSGWSLVLLLSLALLLATLPQKLWAQQDASAPDPQAPAPAAQARYTQLSSDQLEQLVSPIALYPDSLGSQILAASTFPEQVVEADRWVQTHPDLKGEDLGKAVD